ncbi:lauroyl-KDO2-lipid IV(A) myristoyltransferase [Ferrimonas sediminum]|uniref:Lipid A biosynthesis acyltransferase n=1 Tax=Ferrimonas sediminum TaxID=718193 RepID=A0A1G8UKT9_9GAMM|nr:lauroyl-Kdo(2)-lipid IV(A) myristoyltransferase [Ferrimonas sediminum]SDJ54438.1 lauroyl-KDO2-lipid IV(A) myristoyltransferase [Ferrimonas sediminum]
MTSAKHPTDFQHRPRFGWRFLHPRYLGVWLFVAIAAVLALFPYRVRDAVGGSIGYLFGRGLPKTRHRAEVNLKLCFPQWDQAQRDRVLDQMYRHIGMSLMASATLLVRSERYLQNHVELIGEEHLMPYLESGQPVIFMVPHTWFIDFPGVLLASRGYPMTTMVNPQKNELVDYLMQKCRSRYGGKLFGRGAGIKRLLDAIREGHSAYYLPDQDHGMKRSQYVPFFATHKATLPGLGKMVDATGAVVIPMVASYDARRGKFQGIIRPAMTDLPSGDAAYDARRMNEEIEALITPRPEQYMWILKVLKSRPAGEPDPYRR